MDFKVGGEPTAKVFHIFRLGSTDFDATVVRKMYPCKRKSMLIQVVLKFLVQVVYASLLPLRVAGWVENQW